LYRALLEFAITLTRTPAIIEASDIEGLREQGFDDRAIHDACQVVAYFNYVNRIADGLELNWRNGFSFLEVSLAKEVGKCPASNLTP
jgi:alkylhydroperoxidase family enzyme